MNQAATEAAGMMTASAASRAMTELIRERWETLIPKVIDRLRVVLSEALVDPEPRRLVYDRDITPIIEPLSQVFAAGAPSKTSGNLDPAIASRALVATVWGLALHIFDVAATAGIPSRNGRVVRDRPVGPRKVNARRHRDQRLFVRIV